MTAIVLTLFAVPSSQASGATDTQLPGRVTAATAPESLSATPGAERPTSLVNTAPGNGMAHRSVRGTQTAMNRFAGRETLGRRTAMRTLEVALESGGKADCRSARRAVPWYRGRQRDWNALRGVPSRSGRKPHGCADARYLASVARERASIARRAHGRWLERRTLRDFRVTPDSNAWQKAVQEAQRAYPGTRGWLLSCSASEGGWGRWVPNSQGSGVGGWLQYQPGTFSGFYNAARSHVTSRGFRVPSSAASWYSPLGQALAGGWAITHGMRHHWAGTGC